MMNIFRILNELTGKRLDEFTLIELEARGFMPYYD
jgi:hypothetical protein